ncbi:MAG TPA: F0F1 ATP synthase subunit gamma [Chitinophagaceae bacterium]|nr:F0F1 ATP synthase subunit gamma [Chitinophagaceae bacterium]
MDTLESLRTKIDGAKDLKSVVKTMKAVAASNIGQYESAVASLGDYYRTIALGIIAYLRAEKIETINSKPVLKTNTEDLTGVVVFGSDQGLVGPFNDSLTAFVNTSLKDIPGKKEIWAVGERIPLLLADVGFAPAKLFSVPGTVNAVTPLVGEIIITAQENLDKGELKAVYIFHNQPKPGAGYLPVMQRLLPLDEKWRSTITELKWPNNKIPQVAGGLQPTLSALIREYLFVSLFKACTESLASENASRLNSMQRAEKNIGDLLDDLNKNYHRLRQSSIDEELFDVVSGFEALKNGTN